MMIYRTLLILALLLLSTQYSTLSIAQQSGATLGAWRLCHGADGTKGASTQKKLAACEEIIRHRGALSFGYNGALNYPKDTLEQKQVHQLLMAHRDRMLQLTKLDRYEDALDDCNEIQRLLPHASEIVRNPFGWNHAFIQEGWLMKIILLKKLGRLSEALREIEDLKKPIEDLSDPIASQLNDQYFAYFEMKGDIEALQTNYSAAKKSYEMFVDEYLGGAVRQAELFLNGSPSMPFLKVKDAERPKWEAQLRSIREREVSVRAKMAQMDRNLQSGTPSQAPFPEKVAPRPEPIRGPQTEGCRLFPSLC